ncbi:hypothetical protein N7456_012972 [Penicillium angulare]|uniref:Uncharacterized protein n=1 Tax=Penicillium angulare TaxID=116970 RepID=A0A9W9EKT7_9EURO|nr:hypothetical protein N7456_012972 [Penicillium angulare]
MALDPLQKIDFLTKLLADAVEELKAQQDGTVHPGSANQNADQPPQVRSRSRSRAGSVATVHSRRDNQSPGVPPERGHPSAPDPDFSVEGILYEYADCIPENADIEGEGIGEPDICVRCFNSWYKLIKGGVFELSPDCDFDEGRKRKKCSYCSGQRAECKKLPESLRDVIVKEKRSMSEAMAGGDDENTKRIQDRFSTLYFSVHGIVRAELLSNERNRRRLRMAKARQQAREKQTNQEDDGLDKGALTEDAALTERTPLEEGTALTEGADHVEDGEAMTRVDSNDCVMTT